MDRSVNRGITVSAFLVLLVLLTFVCSPFAAAEQSSDVQGAPDGAVFDAKTMQAVQADLDRRDREAARVAERLEDLPKSDLDRGEAIDLFSTSFGDKVALGASMFPTPDIKRLVSETTAIIELDTGKRALLDSNAPLVAPDGSGTDRPIDVTLQKEGDSFETANTAADVSFPDALGDGVQVGDDIALNLLSAPAGLQPTKIDGGDALFYPETETDTDFILSPTPNGFETFTQLRSPDSPTTQRFQLELPEGSSLSLTNDGGAVAKTGSETDLSVSKPTAIDAAGNSVPVTLSLSGDVVTLATEPAADAVYPILVDPIYELYNWSAGNTTTGMSEWSGYTTPPTTLANKYFAPFAGSFFGGAPTLVAWGDTGYYASGAGSQWSYLVPRLVEDQNAYGQMPTSFITSVNFASLRGSGGGDTSTAMAMIASLWDNVTPGFVSTTGYATNGVTQTYSASNTNQNVKQTYFGLMALGNTTLTQVRYAQLGFALIGLGDTGVPTLSPPIAPNGWVGPTSPPISVTASDTGLGVHKLVTKLDVPSGLPTWDTNVGCTGGRSSACPRTWQTSPTKVLNYDASVLPEGNNTLMVSAKDPLGNTSATGSVVVKVDHTAPEIQLTGDITEDRWLSPAQYSFQAAASDALSGTVSLQVKLGSQILASDSATCAAGGCALDEPVVLDSSTLPPGNHVLTVKATDAAGNQSTRQVNLNTTPDTGAPTVALWGPLAEETDSLGGQAQSDLIFETADHPAYVLGVNATDGTPGTWSGISRIDVHMNAAPGSSQPLSLLYSKEFDCSPACNSEEDWYEEIDLSSRPAGTYVVQIRVYDDSGNYSTRKMEFDFDSSLVDDLYLDMDSVVELSDEDTELLPEEFPLEEGEPQQRHPTSCQAGVLRLHMSQHNPDRVAGGAWTKCQSAADHPFVKAKLWRNSTLVDQATGTLGNGTRRFESRVFVNVKCADGRNKYKIASTHWAVYHHPVPVVPAYSGDVDYFRC